VRVGRTLVYALFVTALAMVTLASAVANPLDEEYASPPPRPPSRVIEVGGVQLPLPEPTDEEPTDEEPTDEEPTSVDDALKAFLKAGKDTADATKTAIEEHEKIQAAHREAIDRRSLTEQSFSPPDPPDAKRRFLRRLFEVWKPRQKQ